MAKRKSLARAITESLDEQEHGLAPMIDDLGVDTAGTNLPPPSIILSPDDPFTEVMLDVARGEGVRSAPKLAGPRDDDEVEEPEPEVPEEPEPEPEPEPEEPESDADITFEPDPGDVGDRYDDELDDFSDELKQLDDLETEEPLDEGKRDDQLALAHGGISHPGKMPCATYSTLAGAVGGHRVGKVVSKMDIENIRGTCPIGAKLAQVPGSVCYGCYAAGGRYNSDQTIAAMLRRTDLMRQSLRNSAMLKRWVAAIVESVDRDKNDVFRWHDSGDILGVRHLDAIVEVARLRPRVDFWLPTKEFAVVNRWLATRGRGGRKEDALPGNLNIRLSAHMLFDAISPPAPLTASSVSSGIGYKCPATNSPEKHGKKCDGKRFNCRACWDTKVKNVDYSYHGADYRFRQSLMVSGLREPERRHDIWTPPKKPRGWKAPDPGTLGKAIARKQIEVPDKPEADPDPIRPSWL